MNGFKEKGGKLLIKDYHDDLWDYFIQLWTVYHHMEGGGNVKEEMRWWYVDDGKMKVTLGIERWEKEKKI